MHTRCPKVTRKLVNNVGQTLRCVYNFSLHAVQLGAQAKSQSDFYSLNTWPAWILLSSCNHLLVIVHVCRLLQGVDWLSGEWNSQFYFFFLLRNGIWLLMLWGWSEIHFCGRYLCQRNSLSEMIYIYKYMCVCVYTRCIKTPCATLWLWCCWLLEVVHLKRSASQFTPSSSKMWRFLKLD